MKKAEQKSNSEYSEEVENEIKLALEEPGIVRAKLLEMGARELGQEVQRDSYFQRQREQDRTDGENIRLRDVTYNGTERYGFFTYKSPLDVNARFLKREELETRVENPDTILQILSRLGYELIDQIEKAREMYELGKMHIGLDVIKGLGHFIEIEGPDDEIVSLARDLGLNPDNALNESYSALLKARGGK